MTAFSFGSESELDSWFELVICFCTVPWQFVCCYLVLYKWVETNWIKLIKCFLSFSSSSSSIPNPRYFNNSCIEFFLSNIVFCSSGLYVWEQWATCVIFTISSHKKVLLCLNIQSCFQRTALTYKLKVLEMAYLR